MIAKKLLCFFCLCFSFSGKAQQAFQNEYLAGWNNTICWMDKCSDGGYVIAERSKYGCHYFKTDILGNILWMNVFSTGVLVDYVEETYDNGYIVLCSYLNGFTNYYYLLKTDVNGSLIWSRGF